MSKRPPISQRDRFQVLERDNFTCVYCGAKPPTRLEVDHKHPWSKGGAHGLANFVTACFLCNRGKGSTILSEARESQWEKAYAVDLWSRASARFRFIPAKDFHTLLNFVLMDGGSPEQAKIIERAASWPEALEALYLHAGFPTDAEWAALQCS